MDSTTTTAAASATSSKTLTPSSPTPFASSASKLHPDGGPGIELEHTTSSDPARLKAQVGEGKDLMSILCECRFAHP